MLELSAAGDDRDHGPGQRNGAGQRFDDADGNRQCAAGHHSAGLDQSRWSGLDNDLHFAYYAQVGSVRIGNR